MYRTGILTPTPTGELGGLHEVMPIKHLAPHGAHPYTLRRWATETGSHSLAFRPCGCVTCHSILLLPERIKETPVWKAEDGTEKSSFLCTHQQMGQQISEARNSLGQEGAQCVRCKHTPTLPGGGGGHNLGSYTCQAACSSLSQPIPPPQPWRERRETLPFG